ncbi:MAG: nucleotidyltransferase family protein [Salinibacterium sp.]|nr:nucleotidyltransferase family protein [Salinibacterium sp.]
MLEQLRHAGRTADDLHERSRTTLTSAVRTGAAAGLSQRQIDEAVGRSQPEVSRLLRFQGSSPLGRALIRQRPRVLDLLASHGVRHIRVFGSVARGADSPSSDIDLLVDLPESMSLFIIARVESELAELLGSRVDLVSSRSLRPHLAERVKAEAVRL